MSINSTVRVKAPVRYRVLVLLQGTGTVPYSAPGTCGRFASYRSGAVKTAVRMGRKKSATFYRRSLLYVVLVP
jgi:hypothetical protein